jgi:AcrR family transcriptional regulator
MKKQASPAKHALDAAHRGSYHHGDLRVALIAAAEQVLADGLEHFSLRAAARRAGVSPAAPAYHFGDAAGLLTEVAILGFRELARYLAEWTEKGGSDPLARLRSQGEGYIRFALANPERFHLMFRRDKLSMSERFKAVSMETYSHLQAAVARVASVGPDEVDPRRMALLLASWSMVHGFAHLALDGQLDPMAEDTGLDGFLQALLPLVLGQLGMPSASPGER